MNILSSLMTSLDFNQLILAGVDIAIWILLIEGAMLGAFRWRTGRGLPLASVILICLSGLGLLVALKAALGQAGVHWIGLGLSVGGAAHVIDLVRRIKQNKQNV